jgi:hypothetical protein
MNTKAILIAFAIALLFLQNCKDPEPEPGINFSGRLMTECENVDVVPNTNVELWEDTRVAGNDTIIEKKVASAITDANGYFLFRHTFDSMPMSLRMSDGNNGYIKLAQGVFGIYSYVETFNNIVADVLSNGNKSNFTVVLNKPSQWQTGDSVKYSIAAPNLAGGYNFTFNDASPNTDIVNNVRAFTRIMQFERSKTELQKKFSFQLHADWYLGGQKASKSYWIPTTTCMGDSMHVYQLKY